VLLSPILLVFNPQVLVRAMRRLRMIWKRRIGDFQALGVTKLKHLGPALAALPPELGVAVDDQAFTIGRRPPQAGDAAEVPPAEPAPDVNGSSEPQVKRSASSKCSDKIDIPGLGLKVVSVQACGRSRNLVRSRLGAGAYFESALSGAV
jgi:hypothetical protein